MRLVSFSTRKGPSFGVMKDGGIIDLAGRLSMGCADLKSALKQGQLSEIARVTAGQTQVDYLIDEVSFLPVIPNPDKIFCAGLNYLAHRLEGNHAAVAEAPAIFMRIPESQCGHDQPLVCPRESNQLDFEAEMAVVIGKAGRRIPEADVAGYIAGISAYNDGSVRDWQLASSQWTPGKNFPSTGAFGPWLVTLDELPLERHLRLVCRLNGQEMQSTTTDLMMFPVAKLISHISTFCTLEPGDVIVTGTPGGVGLRRTPPVWMRAGDVVEVELEGVGVLRNRVVTESV